MDLDIIIYPSYRCDGDGGGGEDGMRWPMDYKLSKFITTYLEYGLFCIGYRHTFVLYTHACVHTHNSQLTHRTRIAFQRKIDSGVSISTST